MFKTLTRRAALATSALAVTAGLLAVAPAPAQAACSLNHYRVTQTTGLWSYGGTAHWLRDKHAGDHVVGPNSNVMPNMSGDFRIVYLGGGGLGQIFAAHLDYMWCE
ncbi:MAG TPA: hypothetical protein VFC19_24085 [Candidatus Limnocylindrales bacterium]|nr:hypothetical protein [Candidatus Limnocylindrales bacterium]